MCWRRSSRILGRRHVSVKFDRKYPSTATQLTSSSLLVAWQRRSSRVDVRVVASHSWDEFACLHPHGGQLQ